jgi:hypothetical protein
MQTADGNRYVVNGQTGTYVPANIDAMYANAQIKRSLANASRRTRVASNMKKTKIGGDHTTYTGEKRGLIILVEFKTKRSKADTTMPFIKMWPTKWDIPVFWDSKAA